MTPVIMISAYRGKDGWRWRLTGQNGEKMGTSGQRFASKSNALRAARRIAGARIQLDPSEEGRHG
jgi:uncharacterized protein YegP (UPF0339 family)